MRIQLHIDSPHLAPQQAAGRVAEAVGKYCVEVLVAHLNKQGPRAQKVHRQARPIIAALSNPVDGACELSDAQVAIVKEWWEKAVVPVRGEPASLIHDHLDRIFCAEKH